MRFLMIFTLEKKAGITALCEYSLLSDNDFPTYGVTKKELADTGN